MVRWRKVNFLLGAAKTRLNYALSALRLKSIQPVVCDNSSAEIRLFMKVRNVSGRMDFFLEYYRALGVNRFFIVDNGSTDDTVSIINRHSNCHVFETTESLSKHPYWLRILMQRYGRNHWCVVVDADEFLMFPELKRIGLNGLRDFLVSQSAVGVSAFLLDMYADKPLSDVQVPPGSDPLDVCHFYDPEWQFASNGSAQGGLHRRVFNTSPALEKIPFIFFTDRFQLSLETRPRNARLADVRIALLHFKFINDPKVDSELPADLNLHYEGSLQLRDARDLIASGVIQTSPSFDRFMGISDTSPARVVHVRKVQLPKRPIFIVGFPRSGTTLLTAMLGSHPDLAAVPETHLLVNLIRSGQDVEAVLKGGGETREFLNKMFRHGGLILNDMGLKNVSWNLGEDGDIAISVEKLLAALASNWISKSSGARIVEKTPDHLRYVRAVRALFPNAQIVRIVRDPRDVALSQRDMPWSKPNGLLNIFCELSAYEQHAEEFFVGDRNSFVIRYEDLISKPDEVLQPLCRFLEIPFHSSMLSFSGSGSEIVSSDESWKSGARSGIIESSRTHLWCKKLSDGEKAAAEVVLGRSFVRYNYDSGIRVTWLQKFILNLRTLFRIHSCNQKFRRIRLKEQIALRAIFSLAHDAK